MMCCVCRSGMREARERTSTTRLGCEKVLSLTLLVSLFLYSLFYCFPQLQLLFCASTACRGLASIKHHVDTQGSSLAHDDPLLAPGFADLDRSIELCKQCGQEWNALPDVPSGGKWCSGAEVPKVEQGGLPTLAFPCLMLRGTARFLT